MSNGNTEYGNNALHKIISTPLNAFNNSAFGDNTLPVSTANECTATGASVLRHNTTGENTGTGAYALTENIDGSGNTANGNWALRCNQHGSDNTATGFRAMALTPTDGSAPPVHGGDRNTANGSQSLRNNEGNNNTADGYNAGSANITGQDNTFIGSNANPLASDLINATAIGANAMVSQSNSLILGNNALVGVGVTAPKALMHINGSMIIGYKLVTTQHTPTTYTAQPNDYIIGVNTDVTCPRGDVTIILPKPSLSDTGRLFIIKDQGNNASRAIIIITTQFPSQVYFDAPGKGNLLIHKDGGSFSVYTNGYNYFTI